MKINTSFELDLDKIDLFYNLLKEEDYDFKTKDIQMKINKNNCVVEVDLTCNNVLELKIASSALIKSLEVISKTLQI